MRVATLLVTTLVLSAGIGGAEKLATAVQLADGTVYFTEPPQLISATTTFKEVYVWSARYYFTINVPENAGEPLQRVTIAQKEGTEDIRFDLKDTKAFIGTAGNRGPRLGLGEVTRERKTSTVFVTFSPPVSPGQTVTISLSPYRNPRFSGVYLFGVTAFPAGEKSHGQFLGFGRLQFYEGFRFGFP